MRTNKNTKYAHYYLGTVNKVRRDLKTEFQQDSGQKSALWILSKSNNYWKKDAESKLEIASLKADEGDPSVIETI